MCELSDQFRSNLKDSFILLIDFIIRHGFEVSNGTQVPS